MNIQEKVREFCSVISCDVCTRRGLPKVLRDGDFNFPWPGYIGPNYWKNRVLLLGQNPGVSLDRFNSQDRQMADALADLAREENADALEHLERIHLRVVPTWPVGMHFPLIESGLTLEDIAYTNAVRCRTHANAAPPAPMAAECVTRHLKRWLDWLGPRIVVCIGKWSHQLVEAELKRRGIPSAFINRQRSLSTQQRQENRAAVANLVRRTLRSAARSDIEQVPHLRAVALEKSARSAAPKQGRWGFDDYRLLFQQLGFVAPAKGKTLKHGKRMPSLYFNERDGFVFFTAATKDRARYLSVHWERIPPRIAKDDKPNLITLVPRPGSEKIAFESLLAGEAGAHV